MIETFGDMVRITSTDYNDNALFVIREIILQQQVDHKDMSSPA